MMQEEFKERTGIETSAGYYHGVIEPFYYEDGRQKDEFCAAWIKQYKEAKKADVWESYQRNYDHLYMRWLNESGALTRQKAENEKLQQEIKQLKQENEMYIDAAHQALTRLNLAIEETFNVMANPLNLDLEMVQDALRDIVIKAASKEYVLTQKLERNLPLKDDERQWLIGYVNKQTEGEGEE